MANNGLKLSITAILSKCNDIIVKYRLSDMDKETKKRLINDDDLTYSGNLCVAIILVIFSITYGIYK